MNQNGMKKVLLFGLGAFFLLCFFVLGLAEYMYGDVSWMLGLQHQQTQTAPAFTPEQHDEHTQDAVLFVQDLFTHNRFDEMEGHEVQLSGRISNVNRGGIYLGEDGSKMQSLRGSLDRFYFADVRFAQSKNLLNQLKPGDYVVVQGVVSRKFRERNSYGLVLTGGQVALF